MLCVRSTLRTAPRLGARQMKRPSLAPSSIQGRTYAVTREATENKAAEEAEQASEDLQGDPNMNGNYPDPSLNSALPVKRQFRDPYADWWDPIERRNYGEPVHEDDDILGMISPEAYTHFTPGWGAVLMGCFVASVGVLAAVVSRTYPDKPAVPRSFPGGLEEELGGPRALRARKNEHEEYMS